MSNQTAVSIHVLNRAHNANYLVTPVGFQTSPKTDFWLHMEFEFSAIKSDIVVSGWWITDAQGVEVNLSRLKYDEVQFMAQAMAEEFEFHKRIYYDELERAHYQGFQRHEYD